MHFACARRGLDEVHFGGAFSPARRVDFRKSGNVQNVRVLRGVQNRRKGCSKLEVVKNVHFSWQAQYLVLLKSVLERSKCSFVKLSSNLDRLCRHHFAWQLQDFVCLGLIFSWQAQYLRHKTSKNRISYCNSDVKVRSEL